ncbi:MAG: hypothetical protein IK051_02350 [Rhodocyclaceae bacterium]|nr:hypothetical protein [Rhodocyclaceae bacterium]
MKHTNRNAPAPGQEDGAQPVRSGGLLTGMQEYRDAICQMISSVEHSLLVFDNSLYDFGMESPRAAQEVSRLCARSRLSPCVRILLRKSASLHENAPRLLRLMTLFGHSIELRVMDSEYPLPASMHAPFVVGDQRSIVTRFHYESQRGKYLPHDTSVANRLTNRFEEHWNRAHRGPGVTTLGL